MTRVELRGQLIAQPVELLAFERHDGYTAPGLAGADQRRLHLLHHRPFAEDMWDGLRAPAPFAEQPPQQIRSTPQASMRDRQLKVRSANVEVVVGAARDSGKLFPPGVEKCLGGQNG